MPIVLHNDPKHLLDFVYRERIPIATSGVRGESDAKVIDILWLRIVEDGKKEEDRNKFQSESHFGEENTVQVEMVQKVKLNALLIYRL